MFADQRPPNRLLQSLPAADFEAQSYDINQIQNEVAAVSQEMARLNSLITEASERAARTVSKIS